METTNGNLYDYPRYYDLVFGSDWKAEFDFLTGCFEQLTRRKVTRLFEPACGTGRLMYRLGKAGYEVSGLDLNPKAVDYCNKRLKRHGLPESAFVGDMTDFKLKRKVDAAFNTINSFRHLTTGSLAKSHLECVANCLAKGGIYILGLHLTPTIGESTDEESWSAQRGHLCVNTHMWTIERNLKNREERFGMTYDVHTPTNSFRIEDVIAFRTYTAEEFVDLIDSVDRLEIAAIYDFAYDLDEPVDLNPETEDAVFILRKS